MALEYFLRSFGIEVTLLNLFAPVESTRSAENRYTAQGLGDRLHLLTIAWALSINKSEFVRLHLSGDKLNPRKRASFLEIFAIFPSPNFELVFHEELPESDFEFQRYLRGVGIDALPFYYRDHPGWREGKSGIEVSTALRTIPLLAAPVAENESKTITSQWDTTGARRKFTPSEMKKVLDCYRQEGYEIITVGGEAEEVRYRESLSDVAQLMSKSALHIGVDSGFMHLAQLFLPAERIHVYSKPQNFWSHHLFRGIENGMVLNKNFKKITSLGFQLVSWRYDSPELLRLWHSGKKIFDRNRG